jgi:hypothetical protein
MDYQVLVVDDQLGHGVEDTRVGRAQFQRAAVVAAGLGRREVTTEARLAEPPKVSGRSGCRLRRADS